MDEAIERLNRHWADTARIYTKLVSAGRRGDAVEYFMTQEMCNRIR